LCKCRFQGVDDLQHIAPEHVSQLGLKLLELVPLNKMLAALTGGSSAAAAATARPPSARFTAKMKEMEKALEEAKKEVQAAKTAAQVRTDLGLTRRYSRFVCSRCFIHSLCDGRWWWWRRRRWRW
jgi:hypothetical protein